MKKNQFWTVRYALINATYFAAFCGVHAYASVFLLHHGFTNTQIGILLAVANVLSVLIQPVIAGVIDKKGKLTNRNVSIFSTVSMMILSALLFVIRTDKMAIFIIYAIIYMIQMAYQPLIIAMNFEYAQKGCNINFGLARGIGSVGFAVFSTIMGNVLVNSTVYSLQIAVLIVLFVALVLLVTFVAPESEVKAAETEAEIAVAHNNIFDFAKHYPKFMFLLLATACLFIGHNMLNDFMIQIITPIGGDERHLGYIVSIAAVLELPTMAFFATLSKKINSGRLLQASAVFFTIKIFILYLATGLFGAYASTVCQIAAYALFIPASAYYVNLIMEEMDQVKGQAYINCAVTLGGVCSNLFAGKVLDVSGPKTMLLLGVIISAVGVVIALFSVEIKKCMVDLKK